MTVRVTFLLIVFLSVGILLGSDLYAQQEFFPFVGEITTDKVHLRAGQHKNFEHLCYLNKGQNVLVVDVSYDWYKIRLPKSAKSYASAKYILLTDDKKGKVTGNRLNVRSGAGSNYTVVGKLKKDDIVCILEKDEEWYKIQPIEKSYGWVHEDFLSFKSKDIASIKKEESLMEKQIEEKKQEQKEIESAQKGKELENKNITLVGKLDVETIGLEDIKYRVLIDGKPKYYLQGLNYIFDDFIKRKIKISGILNEDSSKLSYPVIKVFRIELVL